MLKQCKEYLRVDGEFEDETINFLIEMAKTYLYNSTNKTFNQENKTHRMVVLLLVTYWFENRNLANPDNLLDYTLKSMLLQVDLEGDSDAL